MILFLIILSLILALIILLIFIYRTLNIKNKFITINYIDHCKYPSIIGLKLNGSYTNIISNSKDKILITFISGEDINGTYLNSSTFQLINKEKVSRISGNNNMNSPLLFYDYYNIFFSSPYRITSILSKRSYIFPYSQSSFLFNDSGSFCISSISPLTIHKINKINFEILELFMNINWINNFDTLKINSNPILINGLYWIIGSNDNCLVFIVFDLTEKKFINFFSIDIDFKIHNGLIYNTLSETFHIPIIKHDKIQIYNIDIKEL